MNYEFIPAFPTIEQNDFGSWNTTAGMTLLDYFAGKVLQSISAGEGARMVAERDDRYNETNWKEVVAANSYEIAAEMMEVRKKYLYPQPVAIENSEPVSFCNRCERQLTATEQPNGICSVCEIF